MASPNISEIATTAIESRTRQLADNVTDNTALLMRLKQRGKVRPVSGGTVIRQELEYAENSTYKRFSGYEVLNISPSDVFTSAEFNWKQISVAVTMSGLEMQQNAGRERMIDLLEARINNAEKTMVNGISGDIYSDGTSDGGKQIGGLQSLVASAPGTGTVGGINRANWSFWRNQQEGSSSSTNIKTKMQSMWLATCRNMDKADLIVADNTMFGWYWAALQDQQRFTNGNLAKHGFDNLKFASADVVPDGGVGGHAPATSMYFLNTDYIHFRPSSNTNMRVMDTRYATNQDAMVKLILWYGNLTLSNAQLQGRLH